MSGFKDVVGHTDIIKYIQNAVSQNKISHAYILNGQRGAGKKLLASLFAMTLQCESGQSEPCMECRSCMQTKGGNQPDIITIKHEKPASISVDDIREQLNGDIMIKPYSSPYKIYIIPEADLMTVQAQNALLKTLEEPPEYVIFILATTEVHKIPITILSRCQRYDFKRITIDTIAARLSELMVKEGIEVEERAIRYIAKAADGSMRDALSLLDQCIAFYLGQKLTYDHVLEVLGAVDTEVFSRLLREILHRDVVKVLGTLEELIMQGRELSQLATDFTWYMRNLLLAKSSDNMEDVLDVSTENLAQLKEESEMVDYDTLIRYIRIFSELSNQLKYATQKRVMLEVALIKLCKPEMETNQDSLLERIRAVEEKVEQGAVAPRTEVVYVNRGEEAREEKPKVELPKALHEDVQKVAQNFPAIRNQASGMLKSYLKQAKLSVGNQDQLLLVFEDEVAAGFAGTEAHKEEIRSLIEEKIGKTIEIEVRHVEEGRRFEDSFVDIEKLIQMDITIED